MAAKKSLFLVSVFLLATQAHAFGSKAETVSGESASSSVATEGVWITRPDGAQQCAVNSGQSLEDSSSELKKSKVRVLNSQKGSDGKMRAQICGIPSGKTNMFLIPKEDLGKAIGLGFHEVKN